MTELWATLELPPGSTERALAERCESAFHAVLQQADDDRLAAAAALARAIYTESRFDGGRSPMESLVMARAAMWLGRLGPAVLAAFFEGFSRAERDHSCAEAALGVPDLWVPLDEDSAAVVARFPDCGERDRAIDALVGNLVRAGVRTVWVAGAEKAVEDFEAAASLVGIALRHAPSPTRGSAASRPSWWPWGRRGER